MEDSYHLLSSIRSDMEAENLVCGIDISKSRLDICYNDKEGKIYHLKTGNDPCGHNEIMQKLGLNRIYVMESTGPYYLRLAYRLNEAGADVRVVNPIVIKRFIQMNMERNKSDKHDAGWIYRFGRDRNPAEWIPPSSECALCSQIISSIDLIKRQTTMLSNQIHSIDQQMYPCPRLRNNLVKLKEHLENRGVKLDERLQRVLGRWQGQLQKNLTTIPGLGKRAIAMLIVYTEGFKKISNYRQLVALAGLVPREHTSGSSVRGKKGICKMGNVRLRSVLYMCSMTAIRCNKACIELYRRLKESGKNGKVALIAVCNKLLKQAFSIATKGVEYDADYKSQRKLS